MVLITVLIKRDQKIGFVAGGKNFTGTDAYLKDRRPSGNRRGDRHVGHDVLIAATGESGEKRAGGLNSILRITGESNDGVLNVFRSKIGALRRRRRGNRGRVRLLDLGGAWSYRIAH